LWEFGHIRPLHQVGNEEQAMVVSNPFNDNTGRTRLFYAVLRKRDGQWLVERHDYVSPSEASNLMRGFSLNPGMKFDVLAAELIGEWGAVCDSTISMAADGTGTQLLVGPGGPEPGAKPESFKWKVSGATLRRHFADRQENLEILWVDDNELQFLSPKDSEWGTWWRNPQVDRRQPSSGQPHPDKSAGWKTTSQFTVSAGGGTFELVAVSEHRITQWWRPDGTLLPEVWFTNCNLTCSPGASEKVREFVFRADGFRGDVPLCIFPARPSLSPKPADMWTHV
jgi:hypothetical protein